MVSLARPLPSRWHDRSPPPLPPLIARLRPHTLDLTATLLHATHLVALAGSPVLVGSLRELRLCVIDVCSLSPLSTLHSLTALDVNGLGENPVIDGVDLVVVCASVGGRSWCAGRR